jgi:flavin prenyltransferase
VKNLVLAITGASGAIYPKLFIDTIKQHNNINLTIVASSNALRIFKDEIGVDLREYGPKIHSTKTFDVPFVSGSAKMDGMVILPCSTGTLGRIANGVSDDNITRGADVFLKERRRLILVPRETPLSLIHLQNMVKVTEAGATILPAMPSFYTNPKTIEEVAATVVSRIFDHLDIENNLMERWMDTSHSTGKIV